MCVDARGRGTIPLSSLVKGWKVFYKLPNALSVPELSHRLLLVATIDGMGLKTTFGDKTYCIKRATQFMAEGTPCNDLYVLNMSSGTSPYADGTVMVADLNLHHQQLSHGSKDGIRTMVRIKDNGNIAVDTKQKLGSCYGCVYDNNTRATIPQQGWLVPNMCWNVCITNFCSPFQVQLLGDSRYFLLFVDDHSGYCWVYHIKAKHNLLATF